MTTFSQNLGLAEPTPLDPSTINLWGAVLNLDISLLDAIIAGTIPLAVTGGILSLTNVVGQSSQSLNQRFIFTGVLTAQQTVLWPASVNRFFSVANQTTGSFPLVIGASNGSTPAAAAGATVTVIQGTSALLYSDGTNVYQQATTGAVPNHQFGAVYQIAEGDAGGLTTLANAGAISVTVPQPTSSQFGDGWFAYYQNDGPGLAVFTPTSSTIDGAGSSLGAKQGFVLFSDGTNWYTQRGMGALGAQNTVASTSLMNLGNLGTNSVIITGTTAITSFGSAASIDYPLYIVEFAGVLTLTYNATSLILPGNANITTAAGDIAFMLYLGSGNWKCIAYQQAAVSPGVPVEPGRLLHVQVFNAYGTYTYTPTTGTNAIEVFALGAGASGGGAVIADNTHAAVGTGGGAGAPARGRITTSFSGVTITVGQGGVAAAAGADGNAGGQTTFGALITCPGGPKGTASTAQTGAYVWSPASAATLATGASEYNGATTVGGAALILSLSQLLAGAGAASVLGGGGLAVILGAGNPGIAPGSGGSGGAASNSAAVAGGAGIDGLVIVWEYS